MDDNFFATGFRLIGNGKLVRIDFIDVEPYTEKNEAGEKKIRYREVSSKRITIMPETAIELSKALIPPTEKEKPETGKSN